MRTGTAIILGSCLLCATTIILFVWHVNEIRRTYANQQQYVDDQESQSQSHGEDPSHPQVQNSQPSVSPHNTPAENPNRPNIALNVPRNPLYQYFRSLYGLETTEDAHSTDDNELQRYERERSPSPRMDSIPEEESSQTVDVTEPSPRNRQIQHSENSRIPRQVPISIPRKTHANRVSSNMRKIPSSSSSLNDRAEKRAAPIRSPDSMTNRSSGSPEVKGRPSNDIPTYWLGGSPWRPRKSTRRAPGHGDGPSRPNVVSGDQQTEDSSATA
ncbi:MAG: hypothetical protein Q9188_002699 [Gyalolechia gomerana]